MGAFMHFRFYITGSKSALTLSTKGSPSGSYTTVQNWIADQGKQKIQCPQHADVVTFFDNNQVLEKKWKVEVNYKSSSSVITTTVHIVPDDTQQLQERPELSPKEWLDFSEAGKRDTVRKMKKSDEIYNEEFKKLRSQFLEHRIKKILREMDAEGKDDVDKNAFNISHSSASERYSFAKSGHSSSVCVTMGEPCFENPCSYEAVEKVLQHILEEADVGARREWTVIGCDGLPFTLASRIIENTFVCPHCTMEFMDEADFDEHRSNYKHANNDSKQKCRKYNNIVMIPGLGHYEINMTKALFRLLWDIALVDLAKLLGFQSPKAQASCKSANDHHKSWQILTIFMEAMSSELLTTYIKDTRESSPPSYLGFYEWYLGVRNPNYKFMAEVVFTYCLALHVFRAGVRRNNTLAINAGKTKFSPLFFGLNMPIYMETYIRDSFLRIQCPDIVRQFLEDNESYSVSGNESKGEGGDFILEAKNRRTKMWIPSGVPENNRWLNVCRCIDKLEKVRSNVCAALCMCELDPDYAYMYDIEFEVFSFRQHIRRSGYLDDPFESKKHCTLQGKVLDESFIHFDRMCFDNKTEFLDFCVVHKLQERKKFIPIFIFPEDREDFFSIEKKSKSELIKLNEKLAQLDDDDLNSKWIGVKNKKKNEIVKFYKDLQVESG
ncbi:uncharacterized protein LOC134265484 [Saccostrea cucullata]|uniref:uncharacterized protein LOC134265484 n=1 Tax=Saccostrea cuccullata TaxID=36930 RepID=UPI002ED63FA5